MTEVVTSRLRLRQFMAEDAEPLARLYGDDVVMRYIDAGIGLRREAALMRARANITDFNSHWRRHGYGVWAVTDRESGRLLGQCGLRDLGDLDATEILYMLNKTIWGRGFASEAAGAALAFATGARGLRRIAGLVHYDNLPSRRVLEKCGLVYERDALLWGKELAWYSLDGNLQVRIAA